MVVGAMHIHISILLFGLDEWCLEQNLLGHACLVKSIARSFQVLVFYLYSYEFFFFLADFL